MAQDDTLRLLQALTRLLRLERTRAGPGATSIPRLSALAALAEQGVSDLEGLAAQELVSGPAMVDTVKPLVESGLVDKQSDPADRRRVQLRLTADGERHLRAENERLEALVSSLGPGEQKTLWQAAKILREMTNRSRREGR